MPWQLTRTSFSNEGEGGDLHYLAPGIRKAMALRNRTFTKDNSFTVGELWKNLCAALDIDFKEICGHKKWEVHPGVKWAHILKF